MSLDLNKLEGVVELAEGVIRARCPACAESGSDQKGEHLRIYPDGRFGCCVFPRDREHRKRIFALAGKRGRQSIKVRVAVAKAAGSVKADILGRLGQVFGNPAAAYSTMGEPDGPDEVNEVASLPDVADGLAEVQQEIEKPDGPDGVTEVSKQFEKPDATDGGSEVESAIENGRTERTGEIESEGSLCEEGRTLRTPLKPLYVAQQNEEVDSGDSKKCGTHKEFCQGVRDVREKEVGLEPPKTSKARVKLPFFTPGGSLSIPFDSPERYHWWKSDGHRLTVTEIIAELREREREVENGSAF